MLKTLVILLLFFESVSFGMQKQVLGTVTDLQGKAFVLRNPVTKKSDDFEQRVRSGVHQATYYWGWYWEVYPLSHKSPIYYGDLISTQAGSLLKLTVFAVHEILVSGSSQIQIAPDFTKLAEKQTGFLGIYLISGKMRVISTSHDEQAVKISLRSPSMIVDLDQADTLLAVTGKMTIALCVGGNNRVQSIDPQGYQLYLKQLNNYRQKNYQELARLTIGENASTLVDDLELSQGQKIESWEPLNQKDENSLQQLLGAQKARLHLEKVGAFEPTSASEHDLEFFADLLPDISDIALSLNSSFLDESVIEQVPGSELRVEDSNNQTKSLTDVNAKSSLDRFLGVRFNVLSLNNKFKNQRSIGANAGSLEFELRPWRYLYSYLGLSAGNADTKNLADFLGRGVPQPLNSYSHVALGAGGRMVMGQVFSLSLGVSILMPQELSIQYDDLPGNVNRVYTIRFNPIPMLEVGMSFIVFHNLELALRIGKGSSFAQIEAKDIRNSYKSTGFFDYGAVGIGWNVD